MTFLLYVFGDLHASQTRKGTLGARLPLEPWGVSAEQETVSEEAPTPSFCDLAHATDHVHISESELGPVQLIGGNEDNHTGENPANPADARTCDHASDNEASFLQTPTSLDPSPEESPQMFASLLDVLSTLSSGSLSRSPSTSSSSSSSMPVLSPDHQTQWGGDSPSRSPNRSSSEESVPIDFSFDDDILHLRSKAFELDGDLGSIDFLPMPGIFSMVDSFQPGTSVGTIRPPVNSFASDSVSTPSDEDWPPTYGDYVNPELHEADIFDQDREDVDKVIDGHDYEYRTTRKDEDFERHQPSNGRGNNGDEGWRHANTSGSNGNEWGSAGRRGGGRDDRRKDDRNWRAPSAFSTPSDTESEEREEEGTPESHSDSLGDDDVPLAQSIPTALRAQRTIQKQVREEKDERRRRRALQRQQQQRQPTHKQTSSTGPSRHHTQVDRTPLQGPGQPIPSSSHTTRPRTKTLPSNTSRPVVAEDLARRLKDVQDLDALSTSLLNKHHRSPSETPSHSEQFGHRSGDYSRSPNIASADKSIRPMRSFHRPSHADNPREQHAPMPSLAHDMHRLGRSATTASHRGRQHETSARATLESRSKSTRRPQTSDGAQRPSMAPLVTSVFQHVAAPHTPADTADSSPLTPSVPRETRNVSWQQRVFIVDLQRFNALMMTPTTTAKDVIDTLEAQGQLANWAGVGGWMLFEVSQDFGMGWCHSC